MRNLTTIICLMIAVLLGSAGVSWSADFQKGLTAHKSGDYATALREWEPLAEQGYASAQYNLSVKYARGKGVPQDYVYAHMWGNLAASNGNKNGGKLRDIVAKKMTRTQIAEAQTFKIECVRKNYKGC